MEQLSFPLPVNDMNIEVIGYLNDDALYNLCKTSTNSLLLCASSDVWSPNRPSELAPLNFLRPLYKDWIDFYENVRNDYVYVIVDTIDRDRLRTVYLVDNIRTAAEQVIAKLGIKASIEQLNNDLSQYVKAGRSYEIGFARKNIEYNNSWPYDYMLYQVGHGAPGAHMPAFLSWPSLRSTAPLMLAKRSRGIITIIRDEDKLYYSNYTNDNLNIVEEQGYNRLLIGGILGEKIECERVLDYPIFKRNYIGTFLKLKIDLFLVPDRVIDGTNKFFVVTVPTTMSPVPDERNVATEEMALEKLKRYGTFYKSQDLFFVLAALKEQAEMLRR